MPLNGGPSVTCLRKLTKTLETACQLRCEQESQTKAAKVFGPGSRRASKKKSVLGEKAAKLKEELANARDAFGKDESSLLEEVQPQGWAALSANIFTWSNDALKAACENLATESFKHLDDVRADAEKLLGQVRVNVIMRASDPWARGFDRCLHWCFCGFVMCCL